MHAVTRGLLCACLLSAYLCLQTSSPVEIKLAPVTLQGGCCVIPTCAPGSW